METSVVNILSSYGLPGIIIALLSLWVVRQQRELAASYQSRIDDAKAFSERALRLQEGVHRTIDKVESLTDVLIRRSHDE